MTNCPNCGAIITGPTCEYCGTRFHNDSIEQIMIDGMALAQAVEIETLYREALMAMRRHARIFAD